MPRPWIVAAAGLGLACLALDTPAAAAQRLATLPIATSPVTARDAALDRIRLRGADPETTGALPAPTPAGRPPCPPGRRVGTGAGFCVIN